ncbi:MAG: putative middle wall protein precursor, partial [Firmicutes bacterium]|nr:putative middle wall protein precursor [Bacillota bacterium]
ACGRAVAAVGEPISRAEFVTLIVRAFGQEPAAKAMAATEPFPDVRGHWASGYITVAQRLVQQQGATLGLPGGNFRPDDPLTGPEAAAFLMKYPPMYRRCGSAQRD